MCVLKNCIYHMPEGSPYDCDYMLTMIDRGSSEDCRRGCAPGLNCTRYVKGKKKKHSAYAKSRPKAQFHIAAKFFYERGLTDRQIADKMRCTVTEVKRWRLEKGLEANGKRPSFDVATAERMVKEGCSLSEICKALGTTPPTLHKHIATDFRSKSGRRITDNRLELHQAGKTDKEIAEAIGCNAKVISAWRQRHGLAPNKAATPNAKKGRILVKDNRMELYLQGKTDKEISAILGINVHAMQNWRQTRKLKPNKEKK